MVQQEFRKVFALRMRQLRNGRSYRQFSRDIQAKTGFYICFSNLREYELPNGPMPRREALEALVKYSGKPLFWFYQTDADIIKFGLLHPNPNAPKTLLSGALDQELEKYKDLIEDLNSLSPEEREAIELMIRSMAATKKEQTAAGE